MGMRNNYFPQNETNSTAPEESWLEDDPFLLNMVPFQGTNSFIFVGASENSATFFDDFFNKKPKRKFGQGKYLLAKLRCCFVCFSNISPKDMIPWTLRPKWIPWKFIRLSTNKKTTNFHNFPPKSEPTFSAWIHSSLYCLQKKGCQTAKMWTPRSAEKKNNQTTTKEGGESRSKSKALKENIIQTNM